MLSQITPNPGDQDLGGGLNPEKPDPEIIVDDPDESFTESTAFDHWNPDCDPGVGNVAMVFCTSSPRYDSCEINGVPMKLHGSPDEGRAVWATRGVPRHTGGEMICIKGSIVHKFTVRGTGPKQCGSCRRGSC